MDDRSSRLKRLEENVRELEHLRGTTLNEMREDRATTWAVRYGVLESIQAVIDVACAIVSRRNLGYPESYADCLRVLKREEILDPELADRLVRAVGMRNVLIHDYLDVDDELVLDALDRLDNFRQFARAVRNL